MTEHKGDFASGVSEALGAEVTRVRRLSGGASRMTWSVDLADGQRRILQRQAPGGLRGGDALSVEARLLSAMAEGGVPVPPVVAFGDGSTDPGGEGFGWLVTGFLEGETIPRRLLRDQQFDSVRPRLAFDCGAALRRIHLVDPGVVGDSLDSSDQLELFGDLIEELDEPHPAFHLAMRWLRASPPTPRSATVVHGDFRNGNLMVTPDALVAVLDWELAHLGNPIEDLGWFCVRSWRFGSPHCAGGFGSVEELLAGYASVDGVEVGMDELRWWEVFGNLRWAVMTIVQAARHWTGASPSLELAMVGRRTCEPTYDLLRLIKEAGE